MHSARDFIVYTSATVIWWTLSVTCLLPFVIFLKLCKPLRDKWFSWLYIRLLGSVRGAVLAKSRKRAFDLLQTHLQDIKMNATLEILEIGVGGGATLSLYPANTNLTVLEPNVSMVKYFEEARRKNPHINYKKILIAMAEDMHQIDDDSFDVVVGMYVLCSVQCVRSALKEVKRVLKPGGKFLFVLHTTYPSSTWKALLQTLINPLWKIAFNGCNLKNKDDEEIRKSGFSDIETQKIYPKDLWLYVRPQVIGVATK
ncbi:Methyltransferase-like protein 7A like protein [Argiope bruennichi]|uniref:Methyltransferase-like protein 7A like protein n=1 Tax=Argiope bruennichi TaxID=94029 RepID=A0A8T0EIU6_ARGBR|nr:Methyltransferase-like protein 7A like protein [Argiope bruennichi]